MSNIQRGAGLLTRSTLLHSLFSPLEDISHSYRIRRNAKLMLLQLDGKNGRLPSSNVRLEPTDIARMMTGADQCNSGISMSLFGGETSEREMILRDEVPLDYIAQKCSTTPLALRQPYFTPKNMSTEVHAAKLTSQEAAAIRI